MKNTLLLLFSFLLFINLNAQETTLIKQGIIDYELLNKEFPLDTLVSYENDTILLSSFENTIFVISFWYSSCPPCISEIKPLNKLKEDFLNFKIEFLAISFDSENDLKDFLENHPFDFHLLKMNKQKIYKSKLTQGFPTNLILDKNKIIKYQKSGGTTDITKSHQIYNSLSDEIKKLNPEKR